MSKTLYFKVFCLEQYKNKYRMKGADAMRLFKQYGVLEYLGKHYDVLHSFGAQYLVQDIHGFIQVRRKKAKSA
jgi:hypothetical protein